MSKVGTGTVTFKSRNRNRNRNSKNSYGSRTLVASAYIEKEDQIITYLMNVLIVQFVFLFSTINLSRPEKDFLIIFEARKGLFDYCRDQKKVLLDNYVSAFRTQVFDELHTYCNETRPIM